MTTKVLPLRATSEAILLARADIDLYGEVERRLTLCDPDVALLKVLKERIEARHEMDSGDDTIITTGNHYRIQMGAKANERTVVDKRGMWAAMKKALGLEDLIATLDVPLGLIDKTLTKSQQEGLIVKERSGSRKFTVVALDPVDQPKRAA